MNELRLDDLTVRIHGHTTLRHVHIAVRTGEVVALIGSSGAGKTLVARALLNALPSPCVRTSGQLRVAIDGRRHAPWEIPAVGGSIHRVVGWVPQDARLALCPGWTVARHLHASGATAPGAADHVLRRAGFSEPNSVLSLLPHQLSGGMATRVALAQALAVPRAFLVADEPTTGLDPHVQRAVADELKRLAAAGLGIIFVTHDLALLRGIAHRVVIMDQGRVEEETTADALWSGNAASAAGRALVNGVLEVSEGRLT